ncbi:signal recognition particle protein [Candidatus Aminicenantes bacterium AC-335-A11]|jgi:signal recognition particle subunit SRP54|nr:signal recognition particle protein [SCandidatus Aminicenantes bacterium Aminicenantia_JdfR_composite]MCP2597235.1 signal recognition particle protein [Candidatus Aminicenantes bacterium AC-335-G13]MCP2605956.1 signal recognition particle protein [Candidatus Aminicenantes bacterium AC-708-I09]MCP2618295.1 signal recognition particle protein [Candidatus Aminicenantes bacterium AC-335-A11]MCP2620400.1 signal recognition particle protein [Candidatus Aminicenantes bacterium AC-334-E05]
MLEQLSTRFKKIVKFIRGEGKITEENISDALRQIKIALLEADVNYKIVKDFIEKIKQKALDQKVIESITPGQQVIKIVKDELTELLGSKSHSLNFSNQRPSIYLLVGLQGSGKTTTCGKLAKWFSKRNKKPLLTSLDLKRPAAQEQLKKIANLIGINFYPVDRNKNLKTVIENLINHAKSNYFDSIIIDTAGRLHVDEELMEELFLIKELLKPVETIYVGDALTGQDAVRSAQLFDKKVGIDSIILTKLDGDARGGAALSIVSVTGKPIKFIGVGEKFDELEVFHPERLASRILGFGDVVTLVEKAMEKIETEKAEELAKKIKKQEFTLEDFRRQLAQLRKLGSLSSLIKFFPSIGPFKSLEKINIDDKKIIHYEAIINSMTLKERENPKIINGRRRLRIAKGSGRSVQEVNQLLKQYFQMKKMLNRKDFKKILNSISKM